MDEDCQYLKLLSFLTIFVTRYTDKKELENIKPRSPEGECL